MSNITLALIVLFILLWLYCIHSAVFGKFKNEKEKVFWIIGLVFVPPLSFFISTQKKTY